VLSLLLKEAGLPMGVNRINTEPAITHPGSLEMKRPFAMLLTLVIVCGIPVGIIMLTSLVASEDTTGIIGALVGVTFGTFAPDIYRALRTMGNGGVGPAQL